MLNTNITKEGARTQLSFDGSGINRADEYRSRLCTFSASANEGDRRQYGKLFAAAPELLAALRLLHDECRAGEGRPALLTLEFAEKAIAKASGGAQ